MNYFEKKLFVIALAIFLAFCPLPGLQKGSFSEELPKRWTGYRGQERNGTTPDTQWKLWSGSAPKVLWKTTVGKGYAAVVVLDGRAYTIGHENGKDTVYCLDANTGKEIWTFSYPSRETFGWGDFPGPRGTPTVDGTHVYTVSGMGQLFCLDAQTGNKVWSRRMSEFRCRSPKWGVACSPLLLGQAVIYDLGKVIALDRKTGRELWQTQDFGAGYSSPIAMERNGRTCIVAFPAFGLVVVDADTGTVLSSFRWKTKHGVNAAMPLPIEGDLFISSGYGTGGARVRPEGRPAREVWRNRNMCNHFNSCVLHEGYLYGFSGNAGSGQLRCIDARTGALKWSQGGMGTGSLTLSGDRLVILGEKGELVIAQADPNQFTPLKRVRLFRSRCWTVPVVADNTFICRNEAGQVICLDVSP